MATTPALVALAALALSSSSPHSEAADMPVLGGAAQSSSSSLTSLGGPLVKIEEARRRPYRVLLLGTSIQQPNYSLTKLIMGGLMKKWGFGGDRRSRIVAGSLGGTLDPPYNGWLKQPYSGVFYLRAKGVPASSPLVFTGYGDEVVIEWSRETDTAAVEVTVDGSSVGSVGTSGTQKFGIQTVYTVTKGTHAVTINPPASGAFYLEAVEIRDSSRVGVEYIDGTLGGSSLSRCWLVQSQNGSQANPIATAYGTGIRALFARTDVDLIIIGHTVNDAGSGQDGAGPLSSAYPYRDYLRYGLSLAESRGTPVIQIVEPAAHYSLPLDQNYARYISVKGYQVASPAEFPTSVVIDQDTYTRGALGLSGQALADRWYQPASGTPVVVAGDGTFTGDFTHPPYTLASGLPNIHAFSLPEAERVLGLATGTLGNGSGDLLTLSRSRYANGIRCIRPLAPGAGSFPFLVSGWIRDTTLTPISSLTSNITGAGTTDANGKYFEPSVNQAYGLGATTGTTRMLVLRIGPKAGTGTWSINAGSAILFWAPDGSQWPVASNTVSMDTMPDGSVHTVALLVSQTSANQNIVIAGRIYEAALTSVTDEPVFPTQP
jgi:hypothetical protein